MIQKVKLTRVYRGKQIVKKGTPDEREIDKVAIKTDQHGDSWLSSFRVRGTESWNDGDEVSIEVEQNGQYYNFKPVSNTEIRLQKLEEAVFGTGTNSSEPHPKPEEESNPDDIPF